MYLPAVSGLWYILLIAVGLCMILTIAHNVRKDPRKMNRVLRLSAFLGSSMRRSEQWQRSHESAGRLCPLWVGAANYLSFWADSDPPLGSNMRKSEQWQRSEDAAGRLPFVLWVGAASHLCDVLGLF